MKFERVTCPGVPELGPNTLSNCKKSGSFVFISGMVAWDTGMKPLGGNSALEQSKIVFGYIKKLMEAAGGNVNDIAKITMFVTDMRYQPDVWKARKEIFSGDFPCATLVCVSSLFLPELLVEVEAMGILGASS